MKIQAGVAWLSPSSSEISRAREVLRAMTPGGVIDELGFLVLQAAFAQRFYPAVTTPMTRARYLIFVPAIYRHVECSGRAVNRDARRIARELQTELLKALLKNESTAIGKLAGPNIVRTPSEIYWGALGTLGITIQSLSEAAYQERLSRGVYSVGVFKDDDKVAQASELESFWSPAAPISNALSDGAFPSNTSFRLTRREAQYLRERYASVRPFGVKSLLTHLVDVCADRDIDTLEAVAYPWDAPGLDPVLAKFAEHARMLSLFARGTTLQYHRLVIEKKKDKDPGIEHAFEAWWDVSREQLRGWNVDEFFAVIAASGADRRPVQDRAFIKGWIACCTAARSARQVLEGCEAQRIIAEREDKVRPGKQRLKVKYQWTSFNAARTYEPDVLYQLDYRHRVGRQFAQDIADGLRRGQA